MVSSARSARDRKLVYGVEIEREFVNGFSVGLGIGCLSTLVVLWVSLLFTSRLTSISYASLISVFVYPMLLLSAIGVFLLVKGMVGERS